MLEWLSGQLIYENFHDGVGSEGLSTSAAAIKTISEEYQDISRDINELANSMEAVWQGEAAGGARRGAGPLAIQHEQAGYDLATAQDLADRQSGSFVEAKNRVVPVPPEPDEVHPWLLATDVGATYLQQRQEHSAAAQNNVDVMTGYSGASTYNTDNLPKSYGELADDQAGISVGRPAIVDPGTSDGPSGDGAPRGGAPSDGTPGGDTGASGSPRPGGTPGPGGGATTPESFTPSAPNAGGLPVGADSGQTPGRGPGGGFLPVGAGPLGGGESGRGPGGGRGSGGSGGSPRGGQSGAALPRGGGPGAAEPVGARPGQALGGGRGGGMGGFPMGAAGRGRGEEDTERKTPEYLEGGDPEELFDTDQLTAPTAIGAEDDDEE